MPPAKPADSVYPKQYRESAWQSLRRAFRDFLLVPSLVVLAMFFLAVLVYQLDANRPAWIRPFYNFVSAIIFSDDTTTSDFLSALVGSILTVTSITITMLIIALQQASSTLSDQVIDQFVHRRRNQAFVGYFVGLSLYSLFIRGAATEEVNPVLSASIGLVLSILGMYLLVVLMYVTIVQMRPEAVVASIHHSTLDSRKRQLTIIQQFRRRSQFSGAYQRQALAEGQGYVTEIRLPQLTAAIESAEGEVEVELNVSFGSFVSFHTELATVRAAIEADAERVAAQIEQAIELERQRDMRFDAAYGLEQLEMVAWTSVSSAKSNPEPGLIVTRSLRDLLSRFIESDLSLPPDPNGQPAAQRLPVVYRDNYIAGFLETLESIAIASVESKQHQNYAEIFLSIDTLFDRMPDWLQTDMVDLTLRLLPGLAVHFYTREVESALAGLQHSFEQHGWAEQARLVESAREKKWAQIRSPHVGAVE